MVFLLQPKKAATSAIVQLRAISFLSCSGSISVLGRPAMSLPLGLFRWFGLLVARFLDLLALGLAAAVLHWFVSEIGLNGATRPA